MGLTAQKMKECVWLRPELVARIEVSGVDWGRSPKTYKIGREETTKIL
jgi:hypothetical protein